MPLDADRARMELQNLKREGTTLQLYKTIFTISVSNGYLELSDLFHVILMEQIFTEYLHIPGTGLDIKENRDEQDEVPAHKKLNGQL